ncbi:MAG TPA: D-lysine 5,6-aminomutase subunit alpha, partial [Candidatus Coprenecus stercorigallinarum]|nr:D-lysine 5,6-aminomutase subunit alpha [Candidatus Coprenecus stercorigallinarum]
MNSKLGLDSKKVAYARQLAAGIAADVQNFVDGYTTVAVERTLCRLLGIDGVDANSVPLPNVVVDSLKAAGVLSEGALFYVGNAMAVLGLTPMEIAERISAGTLDITKLEIKPLPEIQKALEEPIKTSIERIKARRARREKYLREIGEGPKPYLYVIVATGNIYEDVVQAEAA